LTYPHTHTQYNTTMSTYLRIGRGDEAEGVLLDDKVVKLLEEKKG